MAYYNHYHFGECCLFAQNHLEAVDRIGFMNGDVIVGIAIKSQLVCMGISGKKGAFNLEYKVTYGHVKDYCTYSGRISQINNLVHFKCMKIATCGKRSVHDTASIRIFFHRSDSMVVGREVLQQKELQLNT